MAAIVTQNELHHGAFKLSNHRFCDTNWGGFQEAHDWSEADYTLLDILLYVNSEELKYVCFKDNVTYFEALKTSSLLFLESFGVEQTRQLFFSQSVQPYWPM